MHGTKDAAEVSASAETKPDEYEKLREHMLDSRSVSGAQPKQRPMPKSKGPESVESAEKRRKREATAARAATLRRCKQQLDSVTNDTYDLGELVQKGFPESMRERCSAKIEKFRSEALMQQRDRAVLVFFRVGRVHGVYQ